MKKPRKDTKPPFCKIRIQCNEGVYMPDGSVKTLLQVDYVNKENIWKEVSCALKKPSLKDIISQIQNGVNVMLLNIIDEKK